MGLEEKRSIFKEPGRGEEGRANNFSSISQKLCCDFLAFVPSHVKHVCVRQTTHVRWNFTPFKASVSPALMCIMFKHAT